jgi:hypothetical protein
MTQARFVLEALVAPLIVWWRPQLGVLIGARSLVDEAALCGGFASGNPNANKNGQKGESDILYLGLKTFNFSQTSGERKNFYGMFLRRP